MGTDADGTIGMVNQHGCKGSSACCGSAAVAASYVSGVHEGKFSPVPAPKDCLDAQ